MLLSGLGLVVATCAGACGGAPRSVLDADSTQDVASDTTVTRDGGTIGGGRPVAVHVPPGYQASVPMPLVMMLHGYGASGDLEETYLGLTPLADQRGFLYAHPDGTVDSKNNRFWNATDACCDFDRSNVDDSTYLGGVLADISAAYSVDPKRVFIVGHSSGGFMAFRMACDHADQVAAVASLEGAMFGDATKCSPTNPVSVLEIHGTADQTVLYAGGTLSGAAAVYPSADTTVLDWAVLDGCAETPQTLTPLDIEGRLAGAETVVTSYDAACRPGGHAELWTIEGGAHVPAFSGAFAPALVDFLFAHAKP